ncbi:MAG: hypothetical protein EBQ96_01000 [Proteobacteria bacterium]|nr:hypothetical protein [Pseudomonadota bacterium]
MTDAATLAAIEARFATSLGFYGRLVACFNALAERRYDDPALLALVKTSLQSNGLSAAMPLADILNGAEPVHTTLVVQEAALLTQSSEQAQRRMRILMKSPRAALGYSELGEDDLFAPHAQAVANEITNLHVAYVPYAHQTAANFLSAAQTYPTGPSLKPTIDSLEDRRGRVAQEYVKLRDGMTRGEMSIGEVQAFYRDYPDMTYLPDRDYAKNTLDLCDTHVSIAETSLARLGLRIAQAYLVATSGAGQHALATDPAFKRDYDTKFQETANAFQRVVLHLEGGTVTDGPIVSARHYLGVARGLTPA